MVSHTNLNDVAGPRGVPVFGNLFQLDKESLHNNLEDWARGHGPIYKLTMLGKTVYVVSDAEAIHEILKARPNRFRRRKIIEDAAISMKMNGVFTSDGPLWRSQRVVVSEAFRSENMGRFFPSMMKVTDRLLERLGVLQRAGEAIDLAWNLDAWTLDIMSLLLFNYDLNTLECPGAKVNEHMQQIFPRFNKRINSSVFPYWKYFKLPEDRRLDHSIAEIQQVFMPLIAKARKELDEDPARRCEPANLLEGMLAADHVDGQFSDDDIYGNVFSLLIAGKDAVALTLSWMFYFVSSSEDVQQKIREEVSPILSERPLEYGDIKLLKYTEAVVLETMRLKAIAPMISAQAKQDVDVLGHRFPEGSIFLLLSRFDSLDDAYFTDAKTFNPERWLAPEEVANHCPMRTLPFGGGPRICSGHRLAVVEMIAVTARICHSFSLTNDLGGAAPEENYGFLMAPSPYWVPMTPRQQVRG